MKNISPTKKKNTKASSDGGKDVGIDVNADTTK
jgi:hypothetical protein